jgi:hypothetical protein
MSGSSATSLGYADLLRAMPTDLLRPCLQRVLEVRRPAFRGCPCRSAALPVFPAALPATTSQPRAAHTYPSRPACLGLAWPLRGLCWRRA